MSDTIEQRVARGAAWLDETRPGWRDQISLDQLNLQSNNYCMLGQVFAGEHPDLSGFMVALYFLPPSETAERIVFYGFNPNADGSPSDDARNERVRLERLALEAEWKRVIHASRVPAEQRDEVTA